MKKFISIASAIIFIVIPLVAAANDGMPRVTIEELKAKMDKGADIIILDVRTSESKTKIKGALRIPPRDIETRYKELPIDKEIITYCS